MKRCPECDFIHEDDERLCAMDGAELVNHSGQPFDESVLPQSLPLRNSHGRSLTLVAAGIILAIALFINFRNVAKRTGFQHNPQGTANTYIGPRAADKSPGIVLPVETSTPFPVETPSSSPTRAKTRATTNADNDLPPGRDPFRGVPVASATPLSRPSPSFAPAKATIIGTTDNSGPSTVKRNETPSESRPPATAEKGAKASGGNQKDGSKINDFLRKTARVLKKPFKH